MELTVVFGVVAEDAIVLINQNTPAINSQSRKSNESQHRKKTKQILQMDCVVYK